MGLGRRFELFLNLLNLFFELFLGGFIEFALAKVLGQFFDFLHGLVPVALLHGLGCLAGRAGAKSFILFSCSLIASSPPSFWRRSSSCLAQSLSFTCVCVRSIFSFCDRSRMPCSICLNTSSAAFR